MGKFTIKKTGDEFRYNLKAGNGEIILSGESYTSKQACKVGIASVKKNSTNGDRYEMKKAKDDRLYFTLKAGNGEIIGVSESYNSADACRTGMVSVMKNASKAEIEEVEEVIAEV